LRLFQSFDKARPRQRARPAAQQHGARLTGGACAQDADGFLSKEDLKKLLGNQADVDQLIAAADTNGDGKVRRGEAAPPPACEQALLGGPSERRAGAARQISFYEFNELLRNS